MMGEVFRVIFTRTNRLGLDFAGRLGLGSDFESSQIGGLTLSFFQNFSKTDFVSKFN